MTEYWIDEDTVAREQARRMDEERSSAKMAGSIVIECDKGWDLVLRRTGESAVVKEWKGLWSGLDIAVAAAPVAVYENGTDGRPLPARRTVATTVSVKSRALPNDTLYYAKPSEMLEQAVKSAVKEALCQVALLRIAMRESEKW